jgi:hypothetical protein
MYSLALIIFVVSEKKAFEHFPIGSNVNLCIAVAAILDKAKLYMNVYWIVLYKLNVFCSDMKFKMAATAGLYRNKKRTVCRGPSNKHSCTVWL